MAITDNTQFGRVGAFRFWCQKVLPAVYDDSLSYYELLCKVVDYLNKIVEVTNTQSDAITELQEKLAYFMAGVFDPYIEEKIDEWFDTNQPHLADIADIVDAISENTDDAFSLECFYDFDIDSYYSILKLPISSFTPRVARHTVDFADGCYKYLLTQPDVIVAINGLLAGTMFIHDGVTINETATTGSDGCIIGWTEEGYPLYHRDENMNYTATQARANGYYEAFGIWSALILNGYNYDYSTYLNGVTWYDTIVTKKHTRTCIGWDDDYWYLLTIEGRLPRSLGADYDDMQTLGQKLNIPYLFNCDGGGSTQMWLNHPLQNVVFADSSSNKNGYSSRDISLICFERRA